MITYDRDDFIAHLMGFGLTDKGAQCYFHLLKYGPKTPAPLAKSLHTYREDVPPHPHRAHRQRHGAPLARLTDLYTAVELDTALEAALKKHEIELWEMEVRKRELQELNGGNGSDRLTKSQRSKLSRTSRRWLASVSPSQRRAKMRPS